MKIGMPILYEYDSLEENFILAKELGLDFVELNLNFAYCRKEMEKGNVEELLKKYNLEATLHFYDEGDLASYDEVVDAYLLLLDKYAKLGKNYIKNVNIHNCEGPVVTIAGIKNYIYDKDYDSYQERMSRNLKKAKRILSQYGINMTLENVDRFPKFMEKAYLFEKEEEYDFCYDIGHDNFQKRLFALKDKVDFPFKEFHIHDGKENTCHLALGEGNINIKYFKDLAEKNDAYVVLEVKQKADLLKSVPFFKSL